MRIELDVSVIQTPHRMRGVGATAINFVKNISAIDKERHTFVLFLYEEKQTEALDILSLDGINYEICNLKKDTRINIGFPGKLRKLNGPLNSIRSSIYNRLGDKRALKSDLEHLDAYIQFDQMQIPPRQHNVKTVVVLYDLIPYIMEKDYLWSYRTARQMGDSRRSAVKKSLLRRQYISTLKAVCRIATKLAAISEHTKSDFIKYVGVKESRIDVVHLGINPVQKSDTKKTIKLNRYSENDWGHFSNSADLSSKPFLLYVGGADPRRRIIDLIAAYNNLRARGIDIALALAGDSMKGSANLPTTSLQSYVRNHSYADNIYFLGFVTDEQREWLYKNCIAMVYPSMYEGFGLPILEAMQYGTPVITYKNSSIEEVSGDAVIFVDSYLGIAESAENFVKNLSLRNKYSDKGKKQANAFLWSSTVSRFIRLLDT